MTRRDGRQDHEIRPVRITPGFAANCAGSVLYACGGTTVLVTAQLADSVPPFLEGKGVGWLTAEYAMLPGSTPTRISRRTDGRATEIQRLIGRSLRAIVDRQALGPWTIHVDCDVVNADGGTRTAAITGAYLAVALGLRNRFGPEQAAAVLKESIAAVSVGIVAGRPMVDLDYSEDSKAEVDCNVVRLGSGGLVEVQGTGEGGVYSRKQLDQLLDMAEAGIDQLALAQKAALGDA
ncbi:ribonuclease PH [Paludisphaera soli]|uniref:ribonuclease PH n=1 Tax=Paludisphaera soli TaxID=2712865 RepID=UPI0013ED97F0|nr:ribonuclease PH [Paludisphaera soli]